MSVCLSGLRGNTIFSAPNWDIAPIFFVQIPFKNEHLFCKYFVRLSVGNATKGFATYGCFHPCYFTGYNVFEHLIYWRRQWHVSKYQKPLKKDSSTFFSPNLDINQGWHKKTCFFGRLCKLSKPKENPPKQGYFKNISLTGKKFGFVEIYLPLMIPCFALNI